MDLDYIAGALLAVQVVLYDLTRGLIMACDAFS